MGGVRRRRKWVRIGAILMLAAAAAAYNVICYNQARAILRFSDGGERTASPERLGRWSKLKVFVFGVNVPRPETQWDPADFGLTMEMVSIPVDDNVTLAGWRSDAGREAPLVILFHGYAAEKSDLLHEARVLKDLGSSVLLMDFRGSGDSSEDYSTVGYHEGEDVAAVVAWARAEAPHSRLLLYGKSMGGAAILRAVHAEGVEADGLVVESVFDTLLNAVRHRFLSMGVPAFPGAQLMVFWGGVQFGFDGFRHRPDWYAESVACPILIMHGEEDPRAALADGRRVYEAVPGWKRMVVFPGYGHLACVSKDEALWRASVVEFLRDGLALELDADAGRVSVVD